MFIVGEINKRDCILLACMIICRLVKRTLSLHDIPLDYEMNNINIGQQNFLIKKLLVNVYINMNPHYVIEFKKLVRVLFLYHSYYQNYFKLGH